MQDLHKNTTFRFLGITDETFHFMEDFDLKDATCWARFVEQYRVKADQKDRGWKGEFWGKMMRGASLVYAYTKNDTLYEVLAQTIVDMIESAEESGRISTYPQEKEFDGWDMWSRKYILLGMQYFLEICKDKSLADRIILSMKGQVDYLISKIGNSEDGKVPITETSNFFRGLNSSSILEPIVRLYRLTGEARYLQFATYIVECGGTSVANIFKLAYEGKMYPYQYPLTKAYEMISCFEGLLQYYFVTGEAWCKEAVIHFAEQVLETDFTIIGSSGCTHELFDHSTVRQANTNNGEKMQETCVTVTLMKFFYQMALFTGEGKYVDAFERSYYNAYLGAVNTEKNIGIDVTKIFFGAYPNAIAGALPFDSYSPLTAGVRGVWIGGVQEMHDHHYYGCCACIGSAGIGMVPKMAFWRKTDGFSLNLYIPGMIRSETPKGQKISFFLETEYPKHGQVKIKLGLEEAEEFALSLRIPAWSKDIGLIGCNGIVEAENGFVRICKEWKNGDEVCLTFDMRTKAIYPIAYGSQILMTDIVYEHNYMVPVYDEEDPLAKNHIALRRGPIVLAAENRLGYNVDNAFDILVGADGYVDVSLPQVDKAPYKHLIEVEVPLKNGMSMRLTDYSSAGKLWNEKSKMAAWIRTKL